MPGYPLNPQGNRPTPAGWTGSVSDPASPAGGNGPGGSQPYARRDPDEGSWFWGAVHGAEHFAESAYHSAVAVVHDAEDTAIRVAHVAQAIYLATDYAPDAIRDKIRMDVHELKKAFIPGLVMSLGVLAITTLAGATIAGILVGALTAGAGAIPAAVAGGELGLDAGFLILDAMGIGFLLRTVFEGISQVFSMVKSAMQIAWNAGSSPHRPPMADIETAAYGLAEANAEMVSLLLQGVLIWILSESAVARAGKLAQETGKLNTPAALASRGSQVLNQLRSAPAEMRLTLNEAVAELAGVLRRAGELTRGLADFIEAKFELILKNVTEDAGKQAEQLRRTGAGGGGETDGNTVKSTSGSGQPVKDKSVGGGPHRETSKPANDGLDSHHTPAKDAYKGTNLDPKDGPAIKMDPADHRQTASYGSSEEAEEYRETQRQLIQQGQFQQAVDMDVNDIQSKFPGKYTDELNQMQQYSKTITPAQLAPKN